MAEKEKCTESTANHRYPAKDQIIARLVQIREYTEKAEETLNSMPPNSQNDPKFCQLQEMIAEMRDTEKKLVDILSDYDMESPVRNRLNMENAQGLTHTVYASNFTGEVEDDFSLVEAHANNIDPELMAEREKLKKRCMDSQNRIEALEKQRKYLLEACSRVSENGKISPISSPGFLPEDVDTNKRLQVVREADSLIFSRRCQSAGGLISSEETCENEAVGPNLSELTDKRLEIHNIISEIALLRRAKDESARKIELLQQALKSSEVSETGLHFDSPNGGGDKSENTEFVEELMTDKENGSGGSNAVDPADWMNDSFSQTITRKLVEIQTMREKLEALQSLVHTIPTPSTYQCGNGLDMNSNDNDICKDPSVNSGAGDERYTLEDNGLEYAAQIKSGYSARGNYASSDIDLRRTRNRLTKKYHSRESEGREDFEGISQRSYPCTSTHRLASPVRSFSVYNSREVKPVPIRPQPAAFSDTMIFPGPPRSDREESFLCRNHVNNGGLSDSFQGQRSRDMLSVHDRIVGNPMVDEGRHWMADGATSGSPGFSTTNSQTRLPSQNISNNVAIEKFLSESNSMLKHVVSSIGLIASGMTNQKKQLDSIKNSVDRLSDRFEALLGEVEVPRMIPEEHSDLRRNNIIPGIFPVDNKPVSEMLPNTSAAGIDTRGNGMCEQPPFYQGSRSHPNVFQEMNVGFHGPRDSKGCNPNRETWGSASATNLVPNANYPPEQLNLRAFQGNNAGGSSNSAFYNPNPSSCMKVKRPWVSPSAQLEPNRLMLNNQVPPGNRTNNYWDNFRSQSRQNVLSSSSKSNESYNTVVSVNPETALNQLAGASGTNNFNRSETRHDKNPGAKPIKAVMMKHFVENIGSKKRNQEQQRQVLPQRSVSVGSMSHAGDNSNHAVAGPSHAAQRNGTNDISGDSVCFGMNKRYHNNPGDRFSNKLTPKEANVLRQAQLGQDCLKDVCSKITQLRNDHIRHRTIDALRNFVAQSVLQDEMESHQMEPSTLRGYISGENMQLQGCDPMHSSRVVLPYHGAVERDSRVPPCVRNRGNEQISTSVPSTSRERSMNELWSNSMDVSFLSNDPRLPPYMRIERKNSTVANSDPRQDVILDLCVDHEDAFFSSTSRLPPYLRIGTSRERDTIAPNLMTTFNEAPKSITEDGISQACSSTEAGYSGESANKDVAESSEHRERKQETVFLTEPASPDVLPMYSSCSTFSSNVKYKGRSMNSTNNPWVGISSGLESDDIGEPLQETEANKDELNANEEVAELTEERNPNHEPFPFEKKDTNL
ncbi:unnamed protein product [Allacma fusca]|uniref:Uncharacterized protein n=1 Tax=Allacma fusca TaxID=39272 RepID=A0A8J2PVY1_9HEXA|nr:unnamed protein product [Allacma fusca]